MTFPDQFLRQRLMQPSRPSSEAYAQIGRMLASSVKGNSRTAAVYQQFLEGSPKERAAMEVWENAPLVDDLEPKKP
jgi:hypothetical protein